jgi:hypothetical protein
MNVLAGHVMVFISPSSECYYEENIWAGVCIYYYMHGKRDLYKNLWGKDIHPHKLCLSLRKL